MGQSYHLKRFCGNRQHRVTVGILWASQEVRSMAHITLPEGVLVERRMIGVNPQRQDL
jgi:hypothetical protein